ncbi:hypothetical protein Verru16b_01447 [Lacunisphaera limnophila]|uniref:Uncharacterized protein n=1 Tax=Lacunisphaera limnophila TaxID=1838286 RepID=A0A1D8AU11_9BACT|nr:hypothetical protein [Lacunisphaera limnophila]AOS44385.1 hypothetical protein Verru16b_01447 [Lacunisphaera limnophila]
MSVTYRITLVYLTADASALAPASERLEAGQHSIEDIIRFAEKLLLLAPTAVGAKVEPGFIVHRGDRSYRLAAHQGRIRVHKSVSLFDDYWTADTPAELIELPPFLSAGAVVPTKTSSRPRSARQTSPLRSVLEVAGLFAIAVVLIAVGLRFGLPQKRLSDVPDDITIVQSSDERASVFATVAGSYATGKTPGNSLVIIEPDGRVLLSTIGKDGKPTPPRIQEQARAGRRGSIACVITSFGIIAGTEPPEVVNVGRFQYRRAELGAQVAAPVPPVQS